MEVDIKLIEPEEWRGEVGKSCTCVFYGWSLERPLVITKDT